MRVLVACEYSATVRDAFRRRGHDAWSVDLRPTDGDPAFHFQCDALTVLDRGWDLLIGHPYCTYNTKAGIRWFYHPDDTHLPAEVRRRHPNYPDRMERFLEGVQFFNSLMGASVDRVCLENSAPHGLAMQHIGRYSQIVQPWMFGDPYTKGAALWLKNLPPLVGHTTRADFDKIEAQCHRMAPGPMREKLRSKTYPGIAEAMAEQWGSL